MFQQQRYLLGFVYIRCIFTFTCSNSSFFEWYYCLSLLKRFIKPQIHSCLYFQYNIKKKEEVVEPVQEEPNPLMRKKKTPEELAREAEAEDEDEFTSECFSRVTKFQKRYCSIL